MSNKRLRRSLSAVLVVVIGLAGCAPKGDALYARAEQSLEKGEVQAAVIDLKNLVQDEPQNASARALLGRALLASGDFSAGAIELQKAKDLGAPRALTLVADCQVLLGKGEFDKVLAECQPESAEAAARTELQMVRGRALLGLRRDREARDQFQALLTAQPDSLAALAGLAEATATVDGLAAARAIVDKAPASTREQVQYWLVVGSLSTEQLDLAGAEKAYAHAVELARKQPEAATRLVPLSALAQVQLRQGKVKEAVAASDEMARIAPDHPLVKQLRGQVAAADGRLDEARTLLEQAVAAMPENYEARTMLGAINLQQGNLGQAEMHFSAVLNKQPDSVQVQRLLQETRARQAPPETASAAVGQGAVDPATATLAGRVRLAYLAPAAAAAGKALTLEAELKVAGGQLIAGDLNGAAATLERVPVGSQTDLRRQSLSVIELLRAGDNEKTLAQAGAMATQHGSDAAARNFLGGIYAAAGRLDTSREQFNAAIALEPKDVQTQLNLARLDLAESKAADAEKRFRKVVEADPRNLVATLGVAVAAGAQANRSEAEKWLQKARAEHPESVEVRLALTQLYLGAGDMTKARAAIDEAAKDSPDNAAVSNARGLVLLAAKDLPDALASFQKATKQAPETHAYALNLARAHLLNRDLDSALNVVNGVLKAEPGYLPALVLAAASSLQAGQLEKATGYVERLRQAAPDTPITHVLEGDLAMLQKRYKDAVEHYRKASAGGSNSALVLVQYNAATRAGVARPEKVLEDWLASNPKDASVTIVLAEHRQRNGDVAGAIKLYEGVLALSPDNAVVLNNLAVLYQGKNDSRALEMAKRAYGLAPASPALQDTYGWLLVESGSVDEGLALLRDAVRRMSGNAEVQYHYAAALAKKGNTAEALEMLDKALSGQLPPAAKADAQRLREQLSK